MNGSSPRMTTRIDRDGPLVAALRGVIRRPPRIWWPPTASLTRAASGADVTATGLRSKI